MPLSSDLQGKIKDFLAAHDLGMLYKKYNWAGDTWENGFPKMKQLEIDLSVAAKKEYLTRTHIMAVARWGLLQNPKGVQCPELFRISLYDGDDFAEWLKSDPTAPLETLRENLKGMGPTYFSKILMFKRPQLYGAIDTRLTRVFGRGDMNIEQLRWLSLEVKNLGHGWFIPESQSSWPGEYDTWIEILHHIASLCNTNGHECPHPNGYIDNGLRERGIWIVADVETALFSYASKRLKKEL